jgi:hypothetical protein
MKNIPIANEDSGKDGCATGALDLERQLEHNHRPGSKQSPQIARPQDWQT